MTRRWLRGFLSRRAPAPSPAANRILSHREGVFVAIAVTNAAKGITHDINRDNGAATLRMGDEYSRTTVIDDMHVQVRVTVEFHPIRK